MTIPSTSWEQQIKNLNFTDIGRIKYDTRRIKRISKRTFKIELYTHRESYRSYLGITIKIDTEEIDSSVLYDKEKI